MHLNVRYPTAPEAHRPATACSARHSQFACCAAATRRVRGCLCPPRHCTHRSPPASTRPRCSRTLCNPGLYSRAVASRVTSRDIFRRIARGPEVRMPAACRARASTPAVHHQPPAHAAPPFHMQSFAQMHHSGCLQWFPCRANWGGRAWSEARVLPSLAPRRMHGNGVKCARRCAAWRRHGVLADPPAACA